MPTLHDHYDRHDAQPRDWLTLRHGYDDTDIGAPAEVWGEIAAALGRWDCAPVDRSWGTVQIEAWGYGVRRLVSYTRTDEAGTCYRAAGWVPVALVKGRLDDGGNRALRWLPGLRAPSTETIDRVRWEIGPDAATTRVHRDSDGVWRPVPQEDAAV